MYLSPQQLSVRRLISSGGPCMLHLAESRVKSQGTPYDAADGYYSVPDTVDLWGVSWPQNNNLEG